MVKAKKNLGQHFLTDHSIAKKVACCIENKSFDLAIEIGCGMGILTDFLFELYPDKVLGFDVDAESIEYMHKKHPDLASSIQLQDFLLYDFDPTIKNHVVIGNFPYNISSQIVFKVLDDYALVKYFSGMFQKEVAERLCAEPAAKNMEFCLYY